MAKATWPTKSNTLGQPRYSLPGSFAIVEFHISNYYGRVPKRCPHCKTVKPLSHFNRSRGRLSGRYPICKSCESDYKKKRYTGDLKHNRNLKRDAARIFRKRHPHFYKNYYRRNREKVKRKIAAYRKTNPVWMIGYQIKWQKRNRKRCRNYCQKWRRKPTSASLLRHHQSRYNARKRGAGGSHTLDEWIELKRKHKFKCSKCRKKRKLTRDHIRPVSKGGSDFIENIQPLCQPCNSSKRDHYEAKIP